jgi:hypothetical protein
MGVATGDEPELLRVRQLSPGACWGFFILHDLAAAILPGNDVDVADVLD